MTVYVPGTAETDPKKQNRAIQAAGAAIATNTTDIAALQAGPLVSGAVAAQSDQTTATSTTLAVTPGRQQFHPSASKAWALVTQSAGTYTLSSNYNVASITKNGVGAVVVTFTVPFASTAYCCIASASGGSIIAVISTRLTGAVEIDLRTNGGVATDTEFTVACFGAQ